MSCPTQNEYHEMARVHFFNVFKVRVSIRTCVPNLGSIRGPVRKCCLSILIEPFVHLLSQVELVSSRLVLSAVGLRYERIVGV